MTWQLLILEKEPPIILRWPQKCRADWDVSFSDGVTYRCDSNTYIENDGIDKNDAEIQVDCIIDFVGDTPPLSMFYSRKKGSVVRLIFLITKIHKNEKK